ARFVVFFFQVEKNDLVDIGNKAGGDDDDEDGVDQAVVVILRFARGHDPETQQYGGDDTGIDDVGEKKGYYYAVVRSSGPRYPCADKVHEADIAFPDEESDDDKKEVTGY